MAISSATDIAIPAEAKMPKALLKKTAKGIISTSLRKLAKALWINVYSVERLAKKVHDMRGFNAHTMAKSIKDAKKVGCCNTGRSAGDQNSSPARKIIAITTDARPLRVKQVLIILLPLSSAPGRKRISPIPNPKLEKMDKSPNAAIRAEANPTSAVSKDLATTIKKINPKIEVTAVFAIRKYEFLNSGSFKCCFSSFRFFGIQSFMIALFFNHRLHRFTFNHKSICYFCRL
jgi:hypothetical protein